MRRTGQRGRNIGSHSGNDRTDVRSVLLRLFRSSRRLHSDVITAALSPMPRTMTASFVPPRAGVCGVPGGQGRRQSARPGRGFSGQPGGGGCGRRDRRGHHPGVAWAGRRNGNEGEIQPVHKSMEENDCVYSSCWKNKKRTVMTQRLSRQQHVLLEMMFACAARPPPLRPIFSSFGREHWVVSSPEPSAAARCPCRRLAPAPPRASGAALSRDRDISRKFPPRGGT